MKQLIIIGAGGFGRETYCTAIESIGYGEDYVVKGFLDDNIHALDGFNNYPPIIDTIKDYQPQMDDVFVCAIGSVPTRKKVSEMMIERGGEFITLIHKTAYISMNVKIGKGCMLCAGARLHCDVTIGDYVVIQPYAILGHDVVVGDWTLINAFADCGGMSRIGKECTINTTSFIVPLARIGDNATVGAGSVTMRRVKAGETVFGVPAKPIVVPKINV